MCVGNNSISTLSNQNITLQKTMKAAAVSSIDQENGVPNYNPHPELCLDVPFL